MKLKILNVGGLEEAEIELNGFTVLAGENCSGKSTILKSIYTLIEPGVNLNSKIMEEINSITSFLSFFSVDKVNEQTNKNKELSREEIIEILKKNKKHFLGIQSNQTSTELIIDYLEGKKTEKDFHKPFVKRAISTEFNNQCIKQGAKDCEMSLESNGYETKIVIGQNDLELNVNNKFDYKDIVYIDSPYVIEDYNRIFKKKYDKDHREKLADRLNSDVDLNIFETMVNSEIVKQLDSIIDKAFTVQLTKTNESILFSTGDAKELKPINIATGMKIMLIIKMTIDKGILSPGSVLLIDEPEIHLHPKWQLILAELLITMQKKLGITVVMSTHSPQFLMSIEAFSKKLDTHVDYYFADTKKHTFDNVNGRLEEVYRSMAEPLLMADKLRYGDE